MSFNIVPTPPFVRELKRLAKKYTSVKQDFKTLIDQLLVNPHLGTSLGSNCYKIRMTITSKGKGKSGGARLITYVQVQEEHIFLIAIYDKSESENITDKELRSRLENIDKK